ncbi:hypothetical protein J8273_5837 [Carpediemonas membranifera]|uniref:BED-type domain-containing protein n=1 Tax=Carpediemonas membranifera TaxID=201153 RepID=A0A8J6E945_9EUKA|nr:hypothetical protein J8273_5837 [Carpediemonas membranifera]|eukprot:KAG9392800.1 hypothetical protein J8273_5837 [Carpediemonas membranifera]
MSLYSDVALLKAGIVWLVDKLSDAEQRGNNSLHTDFLQSIHTDFGRYCLASIACSQRPSQRSIIAKTFSTKQVNKRGAKAKSLQIAAAEPEDDPSSNWIGHHIVEHVDVSFPPRILNNGVEATIKRLTTKKKLWQHVIRLYSKSDGGTIAYCRHCQRILRDTGTHGKTVPLRHLHGAQHLANEYNVEATQAYSTFLHDKHVRGEDLPRLQERVAKKRPQQRPTDADAEPPAPSPAPRIKAPPNLLHSRQVRSKEQELLRTIVGLSSAPAPEWEGDRSLYEQYGRAIVPRSQGRDAASHKRSQVARAKFFAKHGRLGKAMSAFTAPFCEESATLADAQELHSPAPTEALFTANMPTTEDLPCAYCLRKMKQFQISDPESAIEALADYTTAIVHERNPTSFVQTFTADVIARLKRDWRPTARFPTLESLQTTIMSDTEARMQARSSEAPHAITHNSTPEAIAKSFAAAFEAACKRAQFSECVRVSSNYKDPALTSLTKKERNLTYPVHLLTKEAISAEIQRAIPEATEKARKFAISYLNDPAANRWSDLFTAATPTVPVPDGTDLVIPDFSDKVTEPAEEEKPDPAAWPKRSDFPDVYAYLRAEAKAITPYIVYTLLPTLDMGSRLKMVRDKASSLRFFGPAAEHRLAVFKLRRILNAYDPCVPDVDALTYNSTERLLASLFLKGYSKDAEALYKDVIEDPAESIDDLLSRLENLDVDHDERVIVPWRAFAVASQPADPKEGGRRAPGKQKPTVLPHTSDPYRQFKDKHKYAIPQHFPEASVIIVYSLVASKIASASADVRASLIFFSAASCSGWPIGLRPAIASVKGRAISAKRST